MDVDSSWIDECWAHFYHNARQQPYCCIHQYSWVLKRWSSVLGIRLSCSCDTCDNYTFVHVSMTTKHPWHIFSWPQGRMAYTHINVLSLSCLDLHVNSPLFILYRLTHLLVPHEHGWLIINCSYLGNCMRRDNYNNPTSVRMYVSRCLVFFICEIYSKSSYLPVKVRTSTDMIVLKLRPSIRIKLFVWIRPK